MAKKVQLMKKINNAVENIYPKSSADNIVMVSKVTTVEDELVALATSLSTLQSNYNALVNRLDIDKVYSQTSAGILLEDDDGTNLIALS